MNKENIFEMHGNLYWRIAAQKVPKMWKEFL